MKKLLFILGAGLILSGCQVGSNGSHTGFISAVEQSGVIWKNYRVYVKTDLSSSQEDRYCVQSSDTDLGNQLKQAEKNRQRVTVKYDTYQYLIRHLFGSCDGDVIKAIEPANQ